MNEEIANFMRQILFSGNRPQTEESLVSRRDYFKLRLKVKMPPNYVLHKVIRLPAAHHTLKPRRGIVTVNATQHWATLYRLSEQLS